jgi:hypothetical protein
MHFDPFLIEKSNRLAARFASVSKNGPRTGFKGPKRILTANPVYNPGIEFQNLGLWKRSEEAVRTPWEIGGTVQY